MTLDPKDKIELSHVRMAKAREFFSDAGANLEGGRYRSSVNRSYYAALNAIRSVLILEGANPETHEGVVTMLSIRFVRTGLLQTNVVKDFKRLLSRRTDVDYGDFDDTGPADASDSLNSAGLIIEKVDALRERLIAELGN